MKQLWLVILAAVLFTGCSGFKSNNQDGVGRDVILDDRDLKGSPDKNFSGDWKGQNCSASVDCGGTPCGCDIKIETSADNKEITFNMTWMLGGKLVNPVAYTLQVEGNKLLSGGKPVGEIGATGMRISWETDNVKIFKLTAKNKLSYKWQDHAMHLMVDLIR